jgi:N-acetylmuramoyl-L-alanine amidase
MVVDPARRAKGISRLHHYTGRINPPARWLAALAAVTCLVVTACGGSAHSAHRDVATTTTAAVTTTTAGPAPTTLPSSTTIPVTTTRAAVPTTAPPTSPPAPALKGAGVLNGKVIAIDPGHNGLNYSNPTYINHAIFNGRSSEACDTTGAATNAGYTEALFNWNVAQVLAADLRTEGATVVLTRTSNAGVGPCVTDRAAIGNNAHANAAVSIHADGGPAGGRGFAILEPVADGPNNAIIGSSQKLGIDIRNAFLAGAGVPVSSYDGVNGIQARSDLGGTNLSTVPKVFIECVNMRNATDAALIVSPAWQAKAAQAIATGLTTFLTGA